MCALWCLHLWPPSRQSTRICQRIRLTICTNKWQEAFIQCFCCWPAAERMHPIPVQMLVSFVEGSKEGQSFCQGCVHTAFMPHRILPVTTGGYSQPGSARTTGDSLPGFQFGSPGSTPRSPNRVPATGMLCLLLASNDHNRTELTCDQSIV